MNCYDLLKTNNHVVKNSHNSKLRSKYSNNKVNATFADKKTCPTTCILHEDNEGGCYNPKGYYTGLMRNRLTNGETINHKTTKTGVDFTQYIKDIRSLPDNELLRVHVDGDLPNIGDGHTLDAEKSLLLASATKNKKAYLYTHYPVELADFYNDSSLGKTIADRKVKVKNNRKKYQAIIKHNLEVLTAMSLTDSLTVNLSANNLTHAIRLKKKFTLPVATVAHSKNFKGKQVKNNVTFIQCPATMKGSKIGCNNCGGSRGALCTRKDRDYVVTFPAHGSGKKSIDSNQ